MMKKTLLSTTALVAASFLSMGVASAEVTVSSTQTYLLNFSSGVAGGAKLGTEAYDSDTPGSEVRQSITTEHETGNIVVKGSGVSDSGLTYGVNVDLNTFSDAAALDEVDVYIGGDSWGKISFGEDDDAMHITRITANTISVGIGGDGTADDEVSRASDSARILYHSPNIGGFELAASFSPQADGSDNTSLDSENLIAVGAKFSRDFGNFGLGVAGGARIQSFTNRTNAEVNGIAIDEETGSQTGFQVGVQGSFDAFTVAASFGSDTENDKTAAAAGKEKETADTYINAGVAYNFGVGGVSLGYYSKSREVKESATATENVKSSVNSIVLDADYKLSEGVTALFQATLDSSDPDTDKDTASGLTDPSATTIKVGLKAAF